MNWWGKPTISPCEVTQYRIEEGGNHVFREHPGARVGRTERKKKSMEMSVTQTIDYR